MKHWQSLALMPRAFAAAMLVAPSRPAAQAQAPQSQPAAPPYIPQARFCTNGSDGLCAIVPAYIGPDPVLNQTQGYNGLYGQPPQSEKADAQSRSTTWPSRCSSRSTGWQTASRSRRHRG
jgi:hypothetical protein